MEEIIVDSKIKEQFYYFNIESEVDSAYGNRAVPKDGNEVNSVYPYAILTIHLKNVVWMEKMKTKVWFKPECEEYSRHVLSRAKAMLYIDGIDNNMI